MFYQIFTKEITTFKAASGCLKILNTVVLATAGWLGCTDAISLIFTACANGFNSIFERYSFGREVYDLLKR